VGVLRIDRADGRPLAAVLNYACHAVSLGRTCTVLTADFPGQARRVLEEATGATCLFLQGAAGDIDPLLMGEDWTHLQRLGLPLGAEAVRVYWAAEPTATGRQGVRSQQRTLQLPPFLPTSETAAEAELAALEDEAAAAEAAGNEADLYWARSRIDRLATALAALREEGPDLPPVQAEFTAVAIGEDLGIVTAPGEIFNEIGRRILGASPFRHNLFAGYTNGSIHYVPTRSAYQEGGYEVTHGCQVAPVAGEMIEKTATELLTGLTR
jgi:hypothetical protein